MEEIKEVSTQLSQIKKKHDEAKRSCVSKQQELDELQEEIKALGVQESQAEGPVFQVQDRLQTLQEQHEDTLNKIAEEQLS